MSEYQFWILIGVLGSLLVVSLFLLSYFVKISKKIDSLKFLFDPKGPLQEMGILSINKHLGGLHFQTDRLVSELLDGGKNPPIFPEGGCAVPPDDEVYDPDDHEPKD
jgi:hypothetical protein|tara:strand:+ start:100 stop:420 length:321 start_codon:yes stop_codon:yes gene_type:complete